MFTKYTGICEYMGTCSMIPEKRNQENDDRIKISFPRIFYIVMSNLMLLESKSIPFSYMYFYSNKDIKYDSVPINIFMLYLEVMSAN